MVPKLKVGAEVVAGVVEDAGAGGVLVAGGAGATLDGFDETPKLNFGALDAGVVEAVLFVSAAAAGVLVAGASGFAKENVGFAEGCVDGGGPMPIRDSKDTPGLVCSVFAASLVAPNGVAELDVPLCAGVTPNEKVGLGASLL